MADPALAWIALGLVRPPDGERYRAIRARHGSPEPLLANDGEDPDLLPPDTRSAARAALPRARREAEGIHALGAHAIAFGDPRYPQGLGEISDPPAWIAVGGDLGDPEAPAVAIVGSREASLAGERRAREWAAWLARRGVRIVSGLARGIDTAAHRGALDADGHTVAVLGCGLDDALAHRAGSSSLGSALAARGTSGLGSALAVRGTSGLMRDLLAAGGALVSDFPLGTRPATWTFPRRNRLISAFARGVLVIQAAARSGSLITARCAGDQGRDVWAVPGAPEDPRARGANALIRQGARLVEDPAEVLEDLLPAAVPGTHGSTPGKDASRPSAQAAAGLSDEERDLLVGVSRGALDLDTLAARAGLSAARAGALLARLEVAGCVRRLDGMRFERA